MAKPPNFANGIPGNDSPYAPELWAEVQPSQNETISRNDMVYTSTVEYKGYYKAQSTGIHKFQLTGGADGFAWVSSANSNSDHIDIEDQVEMVSDQSYGVRIPAKPAGAGYWVFEDMNVLGGQFPGYGYWPLAGYGTSGKWTSYYSGRNLGYTHGAFFPGDIRTYDSTSRTSYGTCPTYCQGSKAGPGWNNPEDSNFNNSDLKYPCDSDWNNSSACRQEGRAAQVFISEAYVAGGSDKRGLWRSIDGEEPFIIWPISQQVTSGLRDPQRCQLFQTVKIKRPGNFKFRFTTRYGIKIWYTLTPYAGADAPGGPRSFRKLDPGAGNNPIASGGGSFTSDVFTTTGVNTRVAFTGSVTGNTGTGDYGYGLEVLDADDGDKVIWDSSKLVADSNGLVGISECGYHALLEDDDRIPTNGISEFYKADGWLGYGGGGLNYSADLEVGDDVERSERDTRQYLWENVTALLYNEQSRPGFVYLRQNDFYFVRVVVANKETGTGQGFAFQVTDPGSNSLQQVTFSGNGDPNADSTVGGGVGGSGIPISKDALCNSVLYAGNVPNTSTTFGVITQTGSVLNLTNLGVPEHMLGTEGQAESVPNENPDVPPGDDGIDSYLVNVGGTRIKLAVLLQGGENGIPPMTPEEKSAVRTTVSNQLDESLTLSFGEFRNAITSQAVIAYGSSGNYRYLYHAVGEVVQSICDDGFTLSAPAQSGNLPGGNNTSGAGDCVDLNIQGTVENSGYVSLSSACVDECKPYDQYEIPSNMESGLAPRTRYMATLPKFQESTQSNAKPGVFYSQARDSGNDFYAVDITEGGDAKIMSWGFFVPDVLPSLTKEEYDERNSRGFNGSFFLSSNTFFKISEDKEYENTSNYGPWVMCWVSLTPGGDPIGGRESVQLYVGRGITGQGMNLYLTMEPYILTETEGVGQRGGVLYIGNTYGKRYFNFAMIKYENFVNDINAFYGDPGVSKPAEERIYPGEDGFTDMLSNAYFQTQQYSLNISPPVQKCTENSGSRTISGGLPAPHSGSGLPSYVDYRPDDDYLSGSTGFGIEGVSTFRGLGRVYFEPCTVRSIPFLIIPGQTSGAIKGVPRAPSFYDDTDGSKTGLSCPGSTLNIPSKQSDGTNYQPKRNTFGWFSRNPGEWDPNTISLFQAGGEVEFVRRFTESNNYIFNITEPTWLYMNFAGFDFSLANDNPVSNNNPFEKVIVPDFNNLWPYRGWYWVMSSKNQQ